MFGFRKAASPSPAKPPEAEAEKKEAPARRTASEPALPVPDSKKTNPFDDDDDDDDFFGKKTTTLRKKPKSKADLDSMSNQELEQYAADQAKETTKSVNNALKIAEDIREDASKTLDTLHAQGEQIHRTHEKAAEMDKDLSRGEKILGNLGGIFSMTWKPKKGKEITGPEPIKDDKADKKASKEDREKLDEALDDLSDVLGDLKGMASEMGSELDRQNKALDDLSEDVDELNSRVKGANTRARKLLDK
ncbi:Target SNARE coiled-coil domain-containing protein [Cynara cardunculus var. scolymus]|uniref:Target SNARE coiled-coil domain-containing protein n=1 Tax=Cynara cardunculus var. scolymus TaxID=59895 RepID=A0A103YAG4_CYNCS|nr:Target SNARE coiled-coil domain-containing protein [Cynara cardunculus var. scolymus]